VQLNQLFGERRKIQPRTLFTTTASPPGARRRINSRRTPRKSSADRMFSSVATMSPRRSSSLWGAIDLLVERQVFCLCNVLGCENTSDFASQPVRTPKPLPSVRESLRKVLDGEVPIETYRYNRFELLFVLVIEIIGVLSDINAQQTNSPNRPGATACAVLSTERLPPFETSHARPQPNCSLNERTADSSCRGGAMTWSEIRGPLA
jgi:hypothetical protein